MLSFSQYGIKTSWKCYKQKDLILFLAFLYRFYYFLYVYLLVEVTIFIFPLARDASAVFSLVGAASEGDTLAERGRGQTMRNTVCACR